jgi:hypothetical protein
MRWLGWSFLYIAFACLGAALLQSLYFHSATLLPVNDFLTALNRQPTAVFGIGHIPAALPPLLLGWILLARGGRRPVRIFGPKRRAHFI